MESQAQRLILRPTEDAVAHAGSGMAREDEWVRRKRINRVHSRGRRVQALDLADKARVARCWGPKCSGLISEYLFLFGSLLATTYR
jgi:hypothetical protein